MCVPKYCLYVFLFLLPYVFIVEIYTGQRRVHADFAYKIDIELNYEQKKWDCETIK